MIERLLLDGVDVGGDGIAVNERFQAAVLVLTDVADAPLPRGDDAALSAEGASGGAAVGAGACCRLSPSRRDRRPAWVSTAIPSALPKPAERTMLAVLRATPGSVTRASMESGTAPPY